MIVDEASQVDLATGVLAFSCARNIVIVGDLKQLPNVLTEDDIRTSDAIWQKYSLDERLSLFYPQFAVLCIGNMAGRTCYAAAGTLPVATPKSSTSAIRSSTMDS